VTLALRVWLALVTLASACDRGSSPATTSATAPAPSASTVAPAATSETPMVLAPSAGIRWVQAPATTDVASVVRTTLAEAHASGRSLVVYEGATWCEPCQRFHHAVDAGELDAAFPRLTILGFDADRDGEALASAGYTSRLIPLLAVPGADGRASGKQIEGSIKGPGAVGEITPRLRALLQGS
jgi:hypothetical protein